MCGRRKTRNLEPFGLDSSFSFNTVLNITPYFLWNKYLQSSCWKITFTKKKKIQKPFPRFP